MTYLIQDNVAHFYNREDVKVDVPNCIVLHTDLNQFQLMKIYNKVINVPFKLNKYFKSL